MPLHGSKQTIQGVEKYFHQDYGWMNKREFLEMPPIHGVNNDDEYGIQPDALDRQSGESFDQYKERLNKTGSNRAED